MTLLEIIAGKRQHTARLANQKGATGEVDAIDKIATWIPRPRGSGLKILLTELQKTGVVVKASSFDAIALQRDETPNFTDPLVVRNMLPQMTFIEIKTANQKRVKEDFSGFFFALTEGEIAASEALGSRHRVVLYNKLTDKITFTSVPEILARAKSTNWQVSIQL